MKFKFIAMLAVLFASFMLATPLAVAQQEKAAPKGPMVAEPPPATGFVRAEEAPAAITQGYIYAGHRGVWFIKGATGWCTFRDNSMPPVTYYVTLKFSGAIGSSYWVYDLEGYPGPPQFALQSSSTTGNYAIYYRVNPSSTWGSLYDTANRVESPLP